MVKVLLDTDIVTDVDDAVYLFLFRHSWNASGLKFPSGSPPSQGRRKSVPPW
jgi:hypothetical protein